MLMHASRGYAIVDGKTSAACGAVVAADRIADDAAEVTCERCKRSPIVTGDRRRLLPAR